MKDTTENALKYCLTGITAVLLVGLVSDLLAPETGLGQVIKFSAPVFTGLITGAWIHLHFRGNFTADE